MTQWGKKNVVDFYTSNRNNISDLYMSEKKPLSYNLIRQFHPKSSNERSKAGNRQTAAGKQLKGRRETGEHRIESGRNLYFCVFVLLVLVYLYGRAVKRAALRGLLP